MNKPIEIFIRHCNQSANSVGKQRPDWFSRKKCWENLLNTTNHQLANITICFDGKIDENHFLLGELYEKYYEKINYNFVQLYGGGDDARSFLNMLNYVKKQDLEDETIIYLLEDDYLHKPNFCEILIELWEHMNVDYATLYDAPDKYIPPSKGGNPFIGEDGAEVTKLYLGRECHFKLCFSTTMTFAAKRTTLERDYNIIKQYTSGTHPHDFPMFSKLTKELGYSMMCPIPGYSTHGETAWLGPLVDWRHETLKLDLDKLDKRFNEILENTTEEEFWEVVNKNREDEPLNYEI